MTEDNRENKAQSDAERQRKRRQKLANEHLKPLLVKGVNGEFDPRIRVALTMHFLASENELPIDLVKKIAELSETIIPTEHFNRKYINKIVMDFLQQDK